MIGKKWGRLKDGDLATEPAQLTSRDDSAIEVKLRDRKQRIWGKLRNLQKHPIADLLLQMPDRHSSHSPIGEIDDAGLVLVDSEKLKDDE
jgi:hypothetical protein